MKEKLLQTDNPVIVEDSTSDFNINLLDTKASNEVILTVKNYDSSQKGLSYKFFEET